MDIEGLTSKTLELFHRQIATCLKMDDENPSGTKDYGVREFLDWRLHKDRIEEELTKRDIKFTPINF